MSGPLGHGSTAGIGSKVGSEASGALTFFNPLRAAEFPGASRAVVRTAWSPQRRDPSHSSEMVSQLVLGEIVEIEGADDAWLLVRGPDGYSGWAHRGALHPVEPEEAARWRSGARSFSLGTRLVGPDGRDRGSAPWGARLPVQPDGSVVTPAGGVARPATPGRFVRPGPPPDARAVCAAAEAWEGTPYLWGGRLRSGADCSGFVQSIFARYAVRLPRDSRDQHASSALLDDGTADGGEPGDVWFFAWEGSGVSHVGICLGDGRMVHASETRGQVGTDTLGVGESGRRLADGVAGAARPLRQRDTARPD